MDLLTRGAGFGYLGSTVTSLIYASFTFIFFALEASIMALALQLVLDWPLVWCYVLSSLVIIPMVLHGITFISRLQTWTQPLWVVLLLWPFAWFALAQPDFYVQFTGLSGLTSGSSDFEPLMFGAAAAVTFALVLQIGEQVDYHAMILHLREGERMAHRDLIQRLVAMQYTRADIDFRRGTFRVRGDVIDVFPAENAELAVRIEMFDDEIEHLTLFDPLTGHLRHKLARFTVYPSSHYVTPRATVLQAIEAIKEELKERIATFQREGKLVEAQRIEQRTRFDLEMLNEMGFCKGIENYSRHLSGRGPGEPPPTLIDYLPQDALMFIDESHVAIGQVGGMYKGDRSRKENLVGYGFRLPSALDNRPLKFDEFERLMPQTVFVSATPAKYEEEHQGQVVEQVVRPTGLIDPMVEGISISTIGCFDQPSRFASR